jgi:hypothetical protein
VLISLLFLNSELNSIVGFSLLRVALCSIQQRTNLNKDSQEAYQLIKINQYATSAQKLIMT